MRRNRNVSSFKTPLLMHRALLAVVVACMLLAGGPAAAADLLEIYRAALSSDPVYSAARASWQAGQEKLPQGRAGLLPQANLSLNTQKNDRDLRFRTPGIPGNESQFNTNALNLTVTQPIYRRQNIAAFEQSKTQLEQADAQLAQATQDLITRVTQAYFDVLLAQDNVAFAGAQKTAIAEQLAQAKRNFEVGNATITDTHDAQARYDLTVSQEIAAQNDLEVKRRQLATLIGRNPPALQPLGRQLPLSLPEPHRIEDWIANALQSSPLVHQAEAALTIATQQISINRAGHHPTLDAFATYSDSGSGASSAGASGGGTDITSKIIGLQLAVPIYQGGAVNSRVREAVANEEKARQDLENARRNAEFAARQGYLGVTSGIAQVKALEAALVSSQSSLDSTRLGQEVGVRTQVDVLNAQQQLFSARRDLAQARYNYILSLLRLTAATGKLTEADLQRVNAWLEK